MLAQIRSMLLLSILLASGMAPLAQGLYGIEDALDPIDESGQGEPEPVLTTGDHAIDRRQEEVQRTFYEAVGELDEGMETAVAAVFSQLPRQPIELYRDRFGPDGSEGRIGQWKVLGDEAWAVRGGSAPDGSHGYTNGRLPDGTYTHGTRSLLVSPELDLRTGIGAMLGKHLPGPQASAWNVFYENVLLGDRMLPQPYYHLEWDLRHNLAQQRDTVRVMVFTQEPDEIPDQCIWIRNCEIQDTLTGAGGWDQGLLDLTPWAEERVWVGVLFESGPRPNVANYWTTANFDRMDFFGVQVDNLVLRTPAAPLNLQVHEVIEPSFRPVGREEMPPVVVPDEDFLVKTLVRNTGSVPLEAEITVEIHNGSGLVSPDHRRILPVPLDAGGSFDLEVYMPPVGNDTEGLEVRLSATRTDATGGGGLLDQDPPMEEIRAPSTGLVRDETVPTVRPRAIDLDNDPEDDHTTLVFDALGFRGIDIRDVQRSAAWVRSGEPLTYSAVVENVGTRHEHVILHAHLVDQDRTTAALAGSTVGVEHLLEDQLIPLDQRVRGLELQPGESQTVVWNLQTSRPGQYRFFVHTADSPDISLEDLRPPKPDLPVLEAPLLLGDVVVDGVIGEAVWREAPAYEVELATPPGAEPRSLNATLRLFHDTETLHVAVTPGDPTEDNQAPGNEDTLRLLFDDLADAFLADGEDGILHRGLTAATEEGTRWSDLSFDRSTLDWTAEASRSGQVRRTFHAGLPGETNDQYYVYEIQRPLRSPGLTAGVGDSIGFMLETVFSDGLQSDIRVRYPASGVAEDGALFALPDGSLDREVESTWARIVLGTGGQGGVGDRLLDPGFGIDRSPPPIFMEDLSTGCPTSWEFGTIDWWNTNAATNYSPMVRTVLAGTTPTGSPRSYVEGWNCGHYDPEGKTLIYQGLHPDSICSRACLPYAALDRSYWNPNSDWSVRLSDAVLYTPPIAIPETTQNPEVFIQHQYGTRIDVGDQAILPGGPPPSDAMRVRNVATIGLEVQDPETGAWSATIPLRPSGGYDTEQSVGIHDPRNGAQGRTIDNQPLGGGVWPESFCEDDQRREGPPFPDTGGPGGSIPFCGWWNPVGRVGTYRAPAPEFVALANQQFGGSPWKIDRVPLYGVHPVSVDGQDTWFGGETDLDAIGLGGKTIRLKLTYVHSTQFWGGVGTHSVSFGGQEFFRDNQRPEIDYGWRIGSIVVSQGQERVSDLAVDSLRVRATYDAERLGLGPGTPVPVVANISNHGLVDAKGAMVRVSGRDLESGQTICEGETTLDVKAGQTAEASAPCLLAPDVPDGTLVRFSAGVQVAGGADDFRINDIFPDRQTFTVRRSPDVEVEVDVSPQVAGSSRARDLFVTLTNTGNVPVTDFAVQAIVVRDEVAKHDVAWDVTGELPVGESREIREIGTPQAILPHHMLYLPEDGGRFHLRATVSGVDGDVDGANDADLIHFRADSLIYANTFDRPASFLPGVVSGELAPGGSHPGTWQVVAGDAGGSMRAGDPVTDEIPAGSDSWIRLPDMDLVSSKSSTLTFLHAHDLERAYDAAVVEMSVDGGATWEPLRPESRAAAGLPDGYTTGIVTGSNAILDGAAQVQNAAYTGKSSDLAGADEAGRVVAEFDLGRSPALRARTPLMTLDVTGLPSDALEDPEFSGPGTKVFTHPAWVPPEVGADAAEDMDARWQIEDLWRNGPRPHSGQTMWWSGSAGEYSDDHVSYVETRLDLRVPPDVGQSGDVVVLTFWDWRPGWLDTDSQDPSDTILRRSGPGGGTMNVRFRGDDGAVQTLTGRMQNVAYLDNGWTQREIDISDLAGRSGVIAFNYSADIVQSPGIQALTNVGWFIDDIAITSYNLSVEGERVPPPHHLYGPDDLEGHVSLGDCQGVGNFTVHITEGLGPEEAPQDSSACWTLTSRGPERPLGWRIDTVEPGPDGPAVEAWHFAQDNDQGYPHGASARVITPALDLSQFNGDSATLRFDHRHQLEFVGGFIRQAVDGGIVTYQALDEATGEWGPWQQLFDEPPERMHVRGGGLGLNFRMGNFLRPQADAALLAATGYPALYPSAYTINWDGRAQATGTGVPGEVGRFAGIVAPLGQGGAAELELGYAFSGDSNGWQEVEWDVSELVGQKVRFGFHAWSNPSYGGTAPAFGWAVANVAVEGEVFQGMPVQLRMRLATDDSLTKGKWSIDDMEVTGTLYERNLAVQTGGSDIRVEPGTPVDLEALVRNIGTSGRGGLVLAVTARWDGNGTLVPVEVLAPDLPELANRSALGVHGLGAVHGPFSLERAGVPGDRLPLQVRLVAPAEEDGSINVQALLLEDRGSDVVLPNGTVQHLPSYKRALDEVVGNTQHKWVVTGQTLSRIEAVPPRADRVGTLVTDTSSFDTDGTVVLQSALRNSGTTPADVRVDWAVEVMGGDPVAEGNSVIEGTVPGTTHLANFSFVAQEPGFYTVTVNMSTDGGDGITQSLDFAVGRSVVYWSQDFADFSGELPAGWSRLDEFPRPDNPQVEFNGTRVQDRLSWGRHPYEPMGYCGVPGICVNTLVEGAVVTPPIDLRQTLNGQAFLTLTHSADYNPNDFGRVDMAVMRSNGTEWVVRECSGGLQFPFITPLQGAALASHDNPRGFTSAGRFEVPAISVYSLSAQSPWCPNPNQPPQAYLGNVVAASLHTMQQSLGGVGSGWQIASVSVHSASGAVGPVTEGLVGGDRLVPIERGASKNYTMTLLNGAAGAERFRFEVVDDPFGSADDWTTFQEGPVPVAAGETVSIPFSIQAPDDAMPGRHPVQVRISGVSDDTLWFVHTIVVDVESRPRPDLYVELDVETGLTKGFERGKNVPVHAHLFNLGDAPSGYVDLDFVLTDEQGRSSVIESRRVEPICAESECGPASARRTMTIEWQVPAGIGDYTLSAEVDPDGSLLEVRRDNNRDALPAKVIPLQVVDLAVTGLEVEGVGLDGFIEAGSLIKATAFVTNQGEVEAKNAHVRILAGTLELTSKNIRSIPPGHTVAFSAAKVASMEGETVLEAVATPDAGLDANPANDRLSRIVRIRSHDLAVTPASQVQEGAVGRPVNFLVGLRNGGNSVEMVRLSFTNATGWAPAVQPDPLAIPPGGNATALVTVTVPGDAPKGDHLIGLHAAPVAAPLAFVQTELVVRVGSRFTAPDVAANNTEGIPGQAAASLWATNHANFPLRLRATPLLPDGWSGQAVVLQLAATASGTADLPLTIPGHQMPGTYPVSWMVHDVDGSWNHTINGTFRVLPHVHVQAGWDDVREGGQRLNGTFYDMPLRLENLGNVALNLSLDPVRVPAQMELAAEGDVKLLPGDQHTVWMPLFAHRIPEGPLGAVQVWNLSAQGNQDLLEELDLPPLRMLPDLGITHFQTGSGKGRVGEGILLSTRIENHGLGASANTTLDLFVDDEFFASMPVPGLLHGEGKWLNITLYGKLGGQHALTAVVDAGRRVVELREYDNVAVHILRLDDVTVAERLQREAPSPLLALVLLALAGATWHRRWREEQK